MILIWSVLEPYNQINVFTGFDVCKETQKLAFTMKLVDSPFGRKPMDPQFERKLEDLLFVKIWNSLRG